jgi:diguanylate cyclase (GGDEF)-like protein/PAS domain S-box-containing protein
MPPATRTAQTVWGGDQPRNGRRAGVARGRRPCARIGNDGHVTGVTAEGGGAFIGSGSSEALARSLMNAGQLAYIAFRPDGTVVFASENVESITGHSSAASVGTNVLDWPHPDDAERALRQMSELNTLGSTPGTSLFRIRRLDGWVQVEVMASLVSDGVETVIGMSMRDASHQLFLEDVLTKMVEGASRAELLRPLCNSIDWELFGSKVVIAWSDEAGLQQVGTGVPDALGGADADVGTPWDQSRSEGTARQGTSADLDEVRHRLARQLGLGAYWIEPVAWTTDRPPATITIWTEEGPRATAVHAYGMGLARNLVELVLRWSDQADRLVRAARSDPLTGLANHRTFFNALAEATTGGAVLYCDLDHFKPVNDDLGHFAGDTVLRVAARRLERCVRDGDLVGRLGGDEFAVLCLDIGADEAAEIAARMLVFLRQPYRVGRNVVRISASIGVAVSSSPVSEDLVHAADLALRAAKTDGRGRVRVAPAR